MILHPNQLLSWIGVAVLIPFFIAQFVLSRREPSGYAKA
jgi:hypothetical protein